VTWSKTAASLRVVVLAFVAIHCGRDPAVAEAGNADASRDAAPPPSGAASTAERIRTRLAACTQLSTGLYKTDDKAGVGATIKVCGLGEDAVYWTADMDIDCDGLVTERCSLKTDPDFQPGTAAESSLGKALDAAELPYVVVPSPSALFDFRKAGLALGTVVMVIYGEKIEYGIIGDTGPASIIGEASYAMAKRLGIDPNPSTGGSDGPVLYVAFKGSAAVVKKNEDHAEAVTIGKARATAVFGPL
jgi:hypothetical protein